MSLQCDNLKIDYAQPNSVCYNFEPLPHFGTLQYSHLTLGLVVKHHGPSGPLDPGLRQ